MSSELEPRTVLIHIYLNLKFKEHKISYPQFCETFLIFKPIFNQIIKCPPNLNLEETPVHCMIHVKKELYFFVGMLNIFLMYSNFNSFEQYTVEMIKHVDNSLENSNIFPNDIYSCVKEYLFDLQYFNDPIMSDCIKSLSDEDY